MKTNLFAHSYILKVNEIVESTRQALMMKSSELNEPGMTNKLLVMSGKLNQSAHMVMLAADCYLQACERYSRAISQMDSGKPLLLAEIGEYDTYTLEVREGRFVVVWEYTDSSFSNEAVLSFDSYEEAFTFFMEKTPNYTNEFPEIDVQRYMVGPLRYAYRSESYQGVTIRVYEDLGLVIQIIIQNNEVTEVKYI